PVWTRPGAFFVSLSAGRPSEGSSRRPRSRSPSRRSDRGGTEGRLTRFWRVGPLSPDALSPQPGEPMDIKDALDRYLTQLKADGRSPHTSAQYQRHVTLLAVWLDERGHGGAVEEIDHETLAQFLASPAARERPDHKTKKATSTNALRTSLRTFFRYCHDGGYT